MAFLLETGAIWYLIIGILLVVMAMSRGFVNSLPLSTSMVYLLIGAGLGPYGAGLLKIDPIEHSHWLEKVTEIVVIISLFAAGLKLRLPFKDGRWRMAVRLASVSMLVTVFLITAFGTIVMGLPLGAAIVLGAILAPTDPVLASDVQVRGPEDSDQLRYGLTGEAGLNDGTAFPFVILGLGLLNADNFANWGLQWALVDLVWATAAGLAVGALLGTLTARFTTFLKKRHWQKNQDIVILDDFLALGLIALSYGVALAVHGYGFLAVFAAGLAIRRAERMESGERVPETKQMTLRQPLSSDEQSGEANAPAILANAALEFDEQLERIGEVAAVLLVGSMLAIGRIPLGDLWLVPFLLILVRPLSVWLGLIGSRSGENQKAYYAWFGIRGIGSLYYLMYAFQHGVGDFIGSRLADIVLLTIAVSIVLHGISVTPLMRSYSERREKRLTGAEVPST